MLALSSLILFILALGYGYICEAAGSRQVHRLDFTPRFVGPQPDFFDSPFRFSQPSKPTIRQLKTFFKSTSQNLIEPLSSALLTLVVEKLELIHDQYIQLQRSKEDLYFSDSSEVERREKYVYLRIDRVIKSVEKLAEVLEEMN